MTDRPFNVLFLCTGNSARSILGEALLNSRGQGRFRAWSAGSHPGGRVNPFALELLAKSGLPTEGLRSKSWDEFAAPGAPSFDFIFTVCDSASYFVSDQSIGCLSQGSFAPHIPTSVP